MLHARKGDYDFNLSVKMFKFPCWAEFAALFYTIKTH
jgi:hypothetical protein